MFAIKENILCFQYMFFFIFIIISFIDLRLIFKNLPDKQKMLFLEKAMDYWKKKPIWKMKVLNLEDSEEPENMEKYPLGYWPGIIKGCNCSKYRDNLYYKGSCSETNLTNNCRTVQEQSAKNIYNFIFKYYVSYYDSDYLTLLSRVEKNKPAICKEGYKKCGYLDSTLLHPFCVKENEDCVANYLFFEKENDYILIYYGFSEEVVEKNCALNNFFLVDFNGCIINEDYLVDRILLFKDKANKLEQCEPNRGNSIYISLGQYSAIDKNYLYQTNNIYKGDGFIPGEKYTETVDLKVMIYYGLNDEMKEYYYSDSYIFKNFKLFNILIFIFLKVIIQFGYFIFIQRVFGRKREIIYNSIWTCIFITYLIFIWLFNNSLYRNSQLMSFDSYEGEIFFNLMKKLRIIDIVLAFIILSVHIFKFLFILIYKEEKKYSEFINKDK